MKQAPIISNAPAAHQILAQRAADMEQSLRASYLASLSPAQEKELRLFTAGEASKLLGITTGYLRKMHLTNAVPEVHATLRGNRYYAAEAIDQIRSALEKNAKTPGSYRKGRKGDEPLAVLAVATFKGGAGKTTMAIHTAQYLALNGYRVLGIDLDPQASFTSYFGIRPEVDLHDTNTLYDGIKYDDPVPLSACVRETYFHNLHLIPADLQLHTFEHETPLWMFEQRQLPEEQRDPFAFYQRLSVALSDVDDDYDIVILDCPPSLGFITLCGLCAATGLLITVVPAMLDVESLSSFMRMTGELLEAIDQNGLSMRWDFQKFVLSRYEPHDGPQMQLAAFLRNLFATDVLRAEMLKSTAIGDAGLTRQALWEVDRHSMNRQTYDRAMEAITAVGTDVERLIHAGWGR
ncbi:plasmid partitioning protein RepA [Amaricoccus sp. W119]|uniref:plasmid partitioning protein RepA n=1 Tax=Amaricoccus sp. W119 TaxID=3391833 RepID=UPI0039A75391